MYKSNAILALIPARGGSKSVKKKNIAPLCGKPLLAYTILAAQAAGCFDDIVVSTDDEEIADVAREWGATVPFLRPQELASDEAKGEPVATHALQTLATQGKTYDLLVYLQPTSPLREAEDILGALNFFLDNKLPSLASVSLVTEHPLFMRTLDDSGRFAAVLALKSDVRRQDLPPYYRLNGAIYINHVAEVLTNWRGNDNLFGFVMDPARSLDIDTSEDLLRAEKFLRNLGVEHKLTT